MGAPNKCTKSAVRWTNKAKNAFYFFLGGTGDTLWPLPYPFLFQRHQGRIEVKKMWSLLHPSIHGSVSRPSLNFADTVYEKRKEYWKKKEIPLFLLCGKPCVPCPAFGHVQWVAICPRLRSRAKYRHGFVKKRNNTSFPKTFYKVWKAFFGRPLAVFEDMCQAAWQATLPSPPLQKSFPLPYREGAINAYMQKSWAFFVVKNIVGWRPWWWGDVRRVGVKKTTSTSSSSSACFIIPYK